MIVKKVRTKKEQKLFLEFPNKLYKKNEFFVPPLFMSEKAIFDKNYHYYEQAEAEYFLAFDDNGNVVGRLSVFIQFASNKKTGESRARFTRFDSIDDENVSNALFTEGVKWAKEKGMTKICGPLGFSDLEREGLLVEGFDKVQTFEEQYNFDYYPKLIEAFGFKKEVDWVEFQIRANPDELERMKKLMDYVSKKHKLRIAEAKNTNDYIEKYGEGLFKLIDEGYEDLYGTVPVTKKMREEIISQFKLILKMENIMCILNEKDEMVAFGLCFPNIGEAMRASGGHLSVKALFRLLSILKSPKIIDLGLIAVKKEYRNTGLTSFFIYHLNKYLMEHDIDHLETNLCLEYNTQIQAQWKYFDSNQVKRRRSYVLDI